MEFKGTKGEWFIDQDESHRMKNGVWCTVISTPKTIGLADVYGDDEEAKANAQLIANSPKLLEALQQAIEMCDKIQFPTEQELKDFVKLGKQVINQATKID
jgi:hypothetical protein